MRGVPIAGTIACVVLGCAVDRGSATAQVPVGGDSPLAALFVRVAGDAGIPANQLAAAAWARTRFRLATVAGGEAGDSVGLVGIPTSEIAHAAALAGVTEVAIASDPESGVRAAAALIREGGLAELGGEGLIRAVDEALARGVDGRDADGHAIVIAAVRATAGFASVTQGLDYAGATWVAASAANYQVASRGVGDIDHIVIHDTEGNFAGTVSWFQDPAAQVSAHYVVRSSDGHIDQMVAEKNVAWHDKCFNTTTVGIEHEGYAAHPELWYTEAMYERSAALTSYLADKYGIAKEHGPIVGHGEAPDCSDHSDPGPGWAWDHYIELVKAGGAGAYLAGDLVVDAPATLASGEIATVTVMAANHGTSAWDLDATRIGTQAPQDRDSALFVDGDWLAPNRATGVDAPTAAGETATFTFQIRGPDVTEPTNVAETFQLLEEGGSW
ncbi:MAG: peptidoglycan recognition family protein, partial [Kofleriaceae bacterium]